MPLNSPLKKPRPDGSVREPSGKVGLRTRASSLTITVPSGKEPVFRYASTFFSSMYTLRYSGKPAFPLLRPSGGKGVPTTTHLRHLKFGNFNLPSESHTAAHACGAAATL